MLKHCSASKPDLGEGIEKTPRKKSRIMRNKLVEEVLVSDALERRLSVSLTYIDQEAGSSDNYCKVRHNTTSNRRTHLLRNHGLSQSLDGEARHLTGESIRVYVSCLRSDIEYRTVRISKTTTASEVITGLLNKYKLKHFDRNLFFLSMEVKIKEEEKTIIRISEQDRLYEMVRCNPWRESCVRLCSKPGCFIRVYDSAIMADSVYKSIRICQDTRVRDVIEMVLECSNTSLTQDMVCLVETGSRRRVMDTEEYLLEDKVEKESEARRLLIEYKPEDRRGGEERGGKTKKTLITRHGSKTSLDSLDSGYSALSA